MDSEDIKALQRDILLGFWKAHILHHASDRPVVGQWILQELRRHGYDVSPGTIYPLLARMEERGWLVRTGVSDRALRGRKEYILTENGREMLRLVVRHVEELYREVVLGEDE